MHRDHPSTRELSRSVAIIVAVVAHVVLDDGPIQHADLERYDDPDIETGLEESGYDAESATYRLIEVDLADLEDTRWFPGPRPWRTEMVEALRRGERLPPVVVVKTARARGFGLIDGLNRTYAHWVAELPTIRAYELIAG